MNKVDTGLWNYYGIVEFVENNGEYSMQLEDWDDSRTVVISKEFFDAAVREFSNKVSDTSDE